VAEIPLDVIQVSALKLSAVRYKVTRCHFRGQLTRLHGVISEDSLILNEVVLIYR